MANTFNVVTETSLSSRQEKLLLPDKLTLFNNVVSNLNTFRLIISYLTIQVAYAVFCFLFQKVVYLSKSLSTEHVHRLKPKKLKQARYFRS